MLSHHHLGIDNEVVYPYFTLLPPLRFMFSCPRRNVSVSETTATAPKRSETRRWMVTQAALISVFACPAMDATCDSLDGLGAGETRGLIGIHQTSRGAGETRGLISIHQTSRGAGSRQICVQYSSSHPFTVLGVPTVGSYVERAREETETT